MKNQNHLQIEISARFPSRSKDEAIAICVFKDEKVEALDESVRRACEQVVRDGEFECEAETSFLFYTLDEGDVRRLLLLGLGARADFSRSVLSRAAGMAVRQARAARVRRLSFLLLDVDDQQAAARAVSEGATL